MSEGLSLHLLLTDMPNIIDVAEKLWKIRVTDLLIFSELNDKHAEKR